MQILLVFSLFLLQTALAHAHFGHVGDVAGHAHWIGTGVIVVGGILAGVLGTKGKGQDEKTDESKTAPDDAEPAGEAA